MSGLAKFLNVVKSLFLIALAALLVLVVLAVWKNAAAPDARPTSELTRPDHVSSDTNVQRQTFDPQVRRARDLESDEVRPQGPGGIFGQVRALDGTPVIAEIVVEPMRTEGVSRRSESRNLHRLESNESGRFELTGLPLGGYTITARDSTGVLGVDAKTIKLWGGAEVAEVLMVLRKGSPLAGHVVNEDGEPVPGAQLAPLLHNGYAADDAVVAGFATFSKDDGSFLFDAMEPDAWVLHVSAEGYAPTLSEPLKVGERGHIIQLERGTVIAGDVRDATSDAPLSGVVVSARLTEISSPVLNTMTQPDGSFSFAIGKGMYAIDLDSPPLVLVGGPVQLNLVPGREPGRFALRAITGGTVRGRLFDAQTNEGISSGSIRARPTDRAMRSMETSTDESGHFEFSGVPAGEYTLSGANIAGYTTRRGFREMPTVQVSPGAIIEDADIALRRGPFVSGKVVDSDDAAMPGARVTVSLASGLSMTITADRNGEFSYAGIDAGDEASLRAIASGWASDTLVVPVPEEGVQGILLQVSLAADCAFGGVVTDQNGVPIQVTLAASGQNSALNGFSFRKTSATGEFLVTDLIADTYSVTATLNNPYGVELATITLSPGQTLINQRLIFPVSQGAISGLVRDSDGNPLSASIKVRPIGAPPNVAGATARSRHDGQFEVKHLEAGAYSITAQKQGYEPQTVDAQTGATDAVIVLSTNRKLSGRVVDAQTGGPIPVFSIASVSDSPGSLERGLPGPDAYISVSDPSGHFSIAAEPYTHGIWVHAEGYQLTFANTVESEDGSFAPLTIELAPGEVSLFGRVIDSTGGGVADAIVRIGPAQRSSAYQAASAASVLSQGDGAYAISGLYSGDVVVSAEHPTLGFGAASARIDPQHAGPVDIVLEVPASVSGLIALDGDPVDGARVTVTASSGTVLYALTDRDGRYEIGRVPPGLATISVEVDDSQELHDVREVSLQSGESADVGFQIESRINASE